MNGAGDRQHDPVAASRPDIVPGKGPARCLAGYGTGRRAGGDVCTAGLQAGGWIRLPPGLRRRHACTPGRWPRRNGARWNGAGQYGAGNGASYRRHGICRRGSGTVSRRHAGGGAPVMAGGNGAADRRRGGERERMVPAEWCRERCSLSAARYSEARHPEARYRHGIRRHGTGTASGGTVPARHPEARYRHGIRRHGTGTASGGTVPARHRQACGGRCA